MAYLRPLPKPLKRIKKCKKPLDKLPKVCYNECVKRGTSAAKTIKEPWKQTRILCEDAKVPGIWRMTRQLGFQ